jgi:acyl-CoA thioester hydrolase
MSGSMVRLDRQRLLNATFAEKVEIATRFDDLDLQGHVNNVAVAVLFQEARGKFNKGHLSSFLGQGRGLVVGSLHIDYAGSLYYPDPVEIETGVLEIGRTSYLLGQVARQGGQIAAFAEVILVMTENGRAMSIPEDVRAVLEEALIPA